jgi:hypothetical protein
MHPAQATLAGTPDNFTPKMSATASVGEMVAMVPKSQYRNGCRPPAGDDVIAVTARTTG